MFAVVDKAGLRWMYGPEDEMQKLIDAFPPYLSEMNGPVLATDTFRVIEVQGAAQGPGAKQIDLDLWFSEGRKRIKRARLLAGFNLPLKVQCPCRVCIQSKDMTTRNVLAARNYLRRLGDDEA